MAGPWEKYQTSPSAPKAPWEKYGASKAKAPAKPSILENIWGKGEADTPGEKLGVALNDAGGELFKGAGRGVRDMVTFLGSAGRPEIARNASRAIGGATEFLNEAPQTEAGKVAGTIGEFAPGLLLGASPVSIVAAGAGSELLGQATEGKKIPDFVPMVGGQDAEPWARGVGSIVAGGGIQALDDTMARRAVTSDFIKGSPSADKLRASAKELYEEASSRGVVASPGQMKLLKSQYENLAKGQGFITPKGNVTKTAPEMNALFKSLDDYLDDAASVNDLQAIRSQLQIIADSATPKVSQMGVKMIKAHDAFVDRLAPELKKANALYTRARRGDMMDQVDDLADVRASQFTGSGRENALRTEFRQLDRNVTKGKIKGLRPDQVQAVTDVSRGTAATNTARNVGKLAPTGVVSAAASGGVPFMVGNSIGGPVLGSLLSAGSMATGIAGRGIATKLQERAAEYASAAMRSGVPIQQIESNLGGGLLAITAIETARQSVEQAGR